MSMEREAPATKKEVWFNEYNVLMGDTVYLPLASGLLHAYALTFPELRAAYRFMPYNFVRASVDEILSACGNPSVAAFSVSMWNLNLSLSVAKALKERFPGVVTVFGGPSVPFDAGDFFAENPFVDIAVRGEGEAAFAEILLKLHRGENLSEVAGISWRAASGRCVKNPAERELPKNLDLYPSPYATGLFDYLFQAHPDLRFQAITETNRGCPFLCSYCSWGQGGLGKKFRFFGLERVKSEAEWFADKKLAYIFCADSNFGIHKRDVEIARIYVELKERCGYPEKFRVCYAKNAENTVYEIGTLLHGREIEKGITLSLQTLNPIAAANVGRKNIKAETYRNLQTRYNLAGIPVYSELILGLPGESYESFRDGIEESLAAGLKNQLFVYFCQVYPNTELNDPAYREKHRIETLRLPLAEVHGGIRPQGLVAEFEDIIISTSTMTRNDWERMAVLAWTMKLFHGLKLAFFLTNYLHRAHGASYTGFIEYFLENAREGVSGGLARFFKATARKVLEGVPCGQERPEYGPLYWDVEEAAFLDIIAEKEVFYGELRELAASFLESNSCRFDREELDAVMAYQRAVIPGFGANETREMEFAFNVGEYFETYFSNSPATLVRREEKLLVEAAQDFGGDKRTYATMVVLYGRKSDRIARKTAPS